MQPWFSDSAKLLNTMNRSLWQAFETPGIACRGRPFWSWSGILEPGELRRQIHVMKEMGLGGFFIHARVGLVTPYLGSEWFDCVKVAVEEAKRLGLEAWLYDEDRWPSGGAGGLVTRDAKCRKRMLFMDTLTDPAAFSWKDNVLAVFTAHVEGSQADRLRRVPQGTMPRRLAPGRVLLVFRWEIDDAPVLDVLSPVAVRRFIDVTHEAYRANVGADFGGVVPGIFTDETSRGGVATIWKGTYHAPWTEALPAVFQQRFGYDLLAHLPEIFFNPPGRDTTPARLHYHECVMSLFVDSYARQLGDWCTQQHLLFTGHFLSEETLSTQTGTVGACMRLYEPMHAPGIDILTAQTKHIAAAKQCTSVARQCGRRWRLTETYGVTGWDFSFEGNKAVGDWQVAMGLNFRCQHMSEYTLEGEAKRDYPGSFLDQAPWWRQYRAVEDYFARVHTVMTQGEEVRDLLVIHPIESMWSMCKVGWDKAPGTADYDRMQVELENALLARHLDFDYGDEEMLARLARVSRRKGAVRLEVGAAVYTTVLVPPLKTMRRSTLRLLRRFRAAGGAVIFAGEIGHYLDGRLTPELADFAAGGPTVPVLDEQALADAVRETRRVSLTDPQGNEIGALLYLLRRDKDAYYLFVCNTGVDLRMRSAAWINDPPVEERRAVFPEVVIRGLPDALGAPVELDPATGRAFMAEARAGETGWEIRTRFDRLESRLFVIPHKVRPEKCLPRPVLRETRCAPIPSPDWTIRRDEPNVVVFDHAGWQLNDGPLQKPEYILRIDRQVRAALGLEPRHNFMTQPWATPVSADPKRVLVRLHYVFTVEALPSGPLALALERPESAQVFLNGTKVSMTPTGSWLDHSFKTMAIDSALLRPGDNTVVVVYDYDEAFPGLEACYLLGEFGVRVDGMRIRLGQGPAGLSLGDLTSQGLPFYGGNVQYEATVKGRRAPEERLFLRIPRYAGTAVRVSINEKTVRVMGWEPYEVDITDDMTNESSRIVVEVLGHRRNVLGPLHTPGGKGANPESFLTEGANWRDDYQVTPFGLLASPELVWKQYKDKGD